MRNYVRSVVVWELTRDNSHFWNCFFFQETPAPYFLCQVSAEGSNTITYSVDDESTYYFSIDPDDGTITTIKEFDYEESSERQFKVV